MEQFLNVYKELKKMVKMSSFYQAQKKEQKSNGKQQKISQKSKKIKEAPLASREELMQKLKNKIDSLKADRTTKKDYVPERKQRQQNKK
ncbi:unnamed protein product (macronuclear) [Paramecium tetraurelia]|uniref:Uncharacterized protein n=1 Tax=Paramecium tetraurelia TaxID=5888 RepID=A0BF80_PARTE|nr:uncharacterized protein GSPATT00028232001 [Paramecium tetraurelia]CAK57197.1 unnamed protein product [Paramecium tetraurelia]|eukprot:XP_001424595.1 hypothetical protein (macronuclear) [Paramecium tetraurelia strain d4-2]